MRYEVVLTDEAVEDLRELTAPVRQTVRNAMERHLRHEPMVVSRSRVKRLSGLSHPQFRLRVDDVRVFYDVEAPDVVVLAVVSKAAAAAWLAHRGVTE